MWPQSNAVDGFGVRRQDPDELRRMHAMAGALATSPGSREAWVKWQQQGAKSMSQTRPSRQPASSSLSP